MTRYSHSLLIAFSRNGHDPPTALASARLEECRSRRELLPQYDDPSAKRAVLALRRGPLRYKRNQMLFCEGDSAEYVYLVISGLVRCYRIHENGRRQIIAFYAPGDLFGLNTGQERAASGEAVTDALIMFFKRSSLLSMASRESGIANLLLAATTYELERLQEHSFSIARSAECRLARFLLDLAGRIANPIAIELQMSRQDIADYLGLTIETVSRSFTKLERAGMIARKGSRRIVLRNRAALQYVIG